MIKKVLLFSLCMLVISVGHAVSSLSLQEQLILKRFNCIQQGYYFTKFGLLVFGKSHKKINQKAKQLFLIKNIFDHPIGLDFPEGHIGASAWITQYLTNGQWIGYLYIPGKDQLPTMNQKIARTKWICSSHFAKATLPCQDLIYVCKITSINNLPKNMLKVLSQSKKSWWSGDPQNSIEKVLATWMIR